jgi:hypothetical protein
MRPDWYTIPARDLFPSLPIPRWARGPVSQGGTLVTLGGVIGDRPPPAVNSVSKSAGRCPR